MESKEKKDKGIAIVGTIVVHALAVLVLFLMAFKTPLPLPGEEGVEVDLGMMDQGMGNIQPEKPAIPMAAQPQQEQTKKEEDIVTQNDEEAPAIEKPKNTKPKQEKPTEEPQQQVIKRALYPSNSKPQAGGSEGITDQPGDQGKPDGDIHNMNYSGNGGLGNGGGTFNENCGYKNLVRPPDDFKQEGDIAVDVHVDREGRVTNPEINHKKTNINDKKMQNEALDAARRSTYNPDPNGLQSERRTIVYHYIKKA